MARAEAHAQRDVLVGRLDAHAGGHGHAVAADDDGALQLGDVLDLFAHRHGAHVALGVAVAAERVEVHRPRHRQHLARVADDEHGADGVPLPALAADLQGQIDDGAQRLQRHLRVEAAQVLTGQPFEVLAEMDDAEAVHGLMRPLTDLDAVVDDDDVGPLVELVAADGFEQGEAHALLGRRRAGVDVEDGEVGVGAELAGQSAVLGRDEESAVAETGTNAVPVEVGFREQQHGVGRQALHELPGRVEQRDGLRRKRHDG